MALIKFGVGDRLVMKKKHPCSSDTFTVVRLGSDVKIRCAGCAKDLTIEREKLEKMIKKVMTENSATKG